MWHVCILMLTILPHIWTCCARKPTALVRGPVPWVRTEHWQQLARNTVQISTIAALSKLNLKWTLRRVTAIQQGRNGTNTPPLGCHFQAIRDFKWRSPDTFKWTKNRLLKHIQVSDTIAASDWHRARLSCSTFFSFSDTFTASFSESLRPYH